MAKKVEVKFPMTTIQRKDFFKAINDIKMQGAIDTGRAAHLMSIHYLIDKNEALWKIISGQKDENT